MSMYSRIVLNYASYPSAAEPGDNLPLRVKAVGKLPIPILSDA